MTLLIKLFITFFKIGLFTFGGGYAMLPMIQEQVQRSPFGGGGGLHTHAETSASGDLLE